MLRNKRIVAIVMSLIMAISMLPAMAFAADSSTPTPQYGQISETWPDYPWTENGQAGDLNLRFLSPDNITIKVDPDFNSKATGYKNYIKDKFDSTSDLKVRYNLNGPQCSIKEGDTSWEQGSKPHILLYKATDTSFSSPIASAENGKMSYIDFICPGSGLGENGSGGGNNGGGNKGYGFDVSIVIDESVLEPDQEYVLVFDEKMSGKVSTGKATPLGCDILFYFGTEPTKISEIMLNHSSATLRLGETTQLTATISPSDAANKEISWTSSDSSVATVDENGKVTAKSVGTATITAAAEDGSGVTASCKITVEPTKVSGIKLNKTTSALKIGEKVQLSAAASPADATSKAVSWTSSNSKVAAVDADGTVTAKSAGDATITAAAKDGSGVKASCQIQVVGNVKAKAASNGSASIKLTWKKVKKADGYTVYRYNKNKKAYRALKNTTKATYINRSLKTGTKQTYKVRAYRIVNGKKVYGNYSAKVSAKPIPATPKMRVKARANKVAVSWKNVSGADKYIVYKSTKKNSGYYKAWVTQRTTFSDQNVNKGKTYYYKMRAYKTVGGKKVFSKYTKVVKVRAK